jgi:hypothetical protein
VTTEPTDQELDALADSLAPFNRRIVLTGAGFSKPWGGYLASELWSVIVSHPTLRTAPETDKVLHDDLNFEKTLARVQADPATFANENGEKILWRAVIDAFEVMDCRMAGSLDNHTSLVLELLLRALVAGITDNPTTSFFTLNQDLLVERTIQDCASTAPSLVVPQIATLVPSVTLGTPPSANVPDFDPKPFEAIKERVSYIKLHGSMNWRVGTSEVVVLGGAKAEAIARFPILRMNNAIFRRALREKNARLLVVGYGFGDDHINEAINQAAASRNGLAMWIVDPRDPKLIRDAMIRHGSLWHAVVGHSPWLADLFRPSAPDRGLFDARFWNRA